MYNSIAISPNAGHKGKAGCDFTSTVSYRRILSTLHATGDIYRLREPEMSKLELYMVLIESTQGISIIYNINKFLPVQSIQSTAKTGRVIFLCPGIVARPRRLLCLLAENAPSWPIRQWLSAAV
jgi:hypothetical protein